MNSPRLAALAALVLCLPFGARASDFVDTRLSFVFADDNILANAGETNPNSPSARFGAGNQNTQFYDNFNTRFSGFETLSFLTLYKSTPTFFEGLYADAAFTVRLLQLTNNTIELRDNSSYIRLWYQPPGWGSKENISITGFPVDADRFRLGYAYRITWGGSSAFSNRTRSQGNLTIPGFKLQLTRDRWYAYVGAKTALILNDLINELETSYGGLAGAGVDVTPNLRLEAGGGYFQKGLNPLLAAQSLRAPVNAIGASAQAVWHVGVPVGTSVDLRLYRNDPDLYQRFFTPEQYPGGLSYMVSLEGSYLAQTLQDPDVSGRTTVQDAKAVALQARAKYNLLRAHILGLYRTVSFIQFDVPGFPPFQDFPSGTQLQPEMFIAGGVDYHFPALHLTPGIIFGVQQPAAFTTPELGLGGQNPIQALLGGRTVVIRDNNLFAVLPTGAKALPVYSAKVTTRWDISETIAGIGEVYYTRDPNRVSFRDDELGVAQPQFEDEDGVGFNLLLQARF